MAWGRSAFCIAGFCRGAGERGRSNFMHKKPATSDQCQSVGRIGSVGARLAGEGVLKSAFAGKPGSYEKGLLA